MLALGFCARWSLASLARLPFCAAIMMLGVAAVTTPQMAVAQSPAGPDWSLQTQNGMIGGVSPDKTRMFLLTDPDTPPAPSRLSKEISGLKSKMGCTAPDTTRVGPISVERCIGRNGASKGLVSIITTGNDTAMILMTEGTSKAQSDWIETSTDAAVRSFGGRQTADAQTGPTVPATRPAVPQTQPPIPATPARQPGKVPTDLIGVDDIEAYVLKVKYGSGYNGAVSVDYVPVIFLKDGTAVRNLDNGLTAANLDNLRRTSPRDIGQWRSAGGSKRVVKWNTGKTSDYTVKPGALWPVPPTASAFAGRYTRTGRGGTAGIAMVVSSKTFTFLPDGRFVRGDYFGGTGSNATVSSKSPDARGRWTIDGVHLILTYDQGETAVTTLLYTGGDTSSPEAFNAIWLSDKSYLRQ